MATTIWQASKRYKLGDKVLPTVSANGNNPFTMKVHVCSAAGKSGSSEPAWVTVENTTTADGSVTWTAYHAYFINGLGGNDANDGAQATPRLTFPEISLPASQQGRAYFQLRGTTTLKRVMPLMPTLTGKTHVSIEPYGPIIASRPVIDASTDVGNGYVAFQNSANHGCIDIEGFRLIGGGAGSSVAVAIQGLYNSKLIDLDISGPGHGIYMGPQGGVSRTGLELKQIYVHDCIGGRGIWGMIHDANSYYTDLVLEDIEVTRCGQNGMEFRSGANNTGALVTGAFRGVTAKRINSHHNTGVGFDCVGLDTWNAASEPYGWFVEDLTADYNGSAGVDFLNLGNTKKNIIRRVKARGNCYLNTTGGIHFNGCIGVIAEWMESKDNHTTGQVDGCGIYLDVFPFPSQSLSDTTAMGRICKEFTLRYNKSSGHKDYAMATYMAAGGANFAAAPPSAGIRIAFADGVKCYSNILTNNSCGLAIDNYSRNIDYFNNTIYGNDIGLCLGQTTATTNRARNNRIFSNIYNVFEATPWERTWTGNLTLSSAAGGADGLVQATNSVAEWTNDSIAPTDEVIVEVGGTGWGIVTKRRSSTLVNLTIQSPFSGTGPFTYGTGWKWKRHVSQHDTVNINKNIVANPIGDGNNFGSTGYNFGNGSALGVDTITTEPVLTFDGYPGEGSAARGAGSRLGNYQDYYGKEFSPVPDIGAIQHVGPFSVETTREIDTQRGIAH